VYERVCMSRCKRRERMYEKERVCVCGRERESVTYGVR